MSEHDRQFSPSASSRWISCTASVPLVEAAGKPRTSNKFSAEGTFAHSMFEKMVDHSERRCDKPKLGIERTVDGFEFEFDITMRNYLEDCLDYVESVGAGLVFSECRVEVPVVYGAAGELTRRIPGTADVIVQPDNEPGVVHIMDLKYGQGVKVYAMGNSQLKLYAAGVLDTLSHIIEDIHTVVLHILQPRLNHFDSFTLSVADLMDWVHGPVADAVSAVLLKRPLHFAPSKQACQWCDVSPCDAALQEAMVAFEPVIDVDPIPPDVLSKFLDSLDLFETVAKAAKERAATALMNNEPVPGYKMVMGKSGARKWADEAAAADTLTTLGYDPYAPVAMRSVAQMEKAVGKKNFNEEDAIRKLIEQPEGKPTLAKESVNKPALSFESVEFEAVK